MKNIIWISNLFLLISLNAQAAPKKRELEWHNETPAAKKARNSRNTTELVIVEWTPERQVGPSVDFQQGSFAGEIIVPTDDILHSAFDGPTPLACSVWQSLALLAPSSTPEPALVQMVEPTTMALAPEKTLKKRLGKRDWKTSDYTGPDDEVREVKATLPDNREVSADGYKVCQFYKVEVWAKKIKDDCNDQGPFEIWEEFHIPDDEKATVLRILHKFREI